MCHRYLNPHRQWLLSHPSINLRKQGSQLSALSHKAKTTNRRRGTIDYSDVTTFKNYGMVGGSVCKRVDRGGGDVMGLKGVKERHLHSRVDLAYK